VITGKPVESDEGANLYSMRRHTRGILLCLNVPTSSDGSGMGWKLFPPPEDTVARFAMGIFVTGAGWTLVVVVGVLLYTGLSGPTFSIAMLATLAASAVGGLTGFLFGVPKGPADRDGQQRVGFYYRPNTNLEQVSDWLTKIIVGVGLIQFREIGGIIGQLGERVGTAVGDLPGVKGSATVFAIGLMSASAVVTFLLAYMWTTTSLYAIYTDTHGLPETTPPPTAGTPSSTPS
jgi:hypothetical protein